MEWISVKDRLPENDDEVIIYCVWPMGPNPPMDEVTSGWFGDGVWSSREDGPHHKPGVVTHWMPLPEPPK